MSTQKMILKDSLNLFIGHFCQGGGSQMGAKEDIWSPYGLEII